MCPGAPQALAAGGQAPMHPWASSGLGKRKAGSYARLGDLRSWQKEGMLPCTPGPPQVMAKCLV